MDHTWLGLYHNLPIFSTSKIPSGSPHGVASQISRTWRTGAPGARGTRTPWTWPMTYYVYHGNPWYIYMYMDIWYTHTMIWFIVGLILVYISLYIYRDARYISTGVNMWNGCDMCGYDLRLCQEEVRNGRAYEAFIVPPTYGKFFRRKMVINPIFFQTDPGCEMPIGEPKGGCTIWLWLTVRHGKIHPFLSSVKHLFRLGPSIFHGKLWMS